MSFKHGFILMAIFATALCRPQENAAPAAATPVPIITQTESVDGSGNFNYSYETGNGIKVEESGIVTHLTGIEARGKFSDANTAPEDDYIVARKGSFSYTAPDGTIISLTYIADENGFQPVGDHLPTPPPIPADIQRSLALQEPQAQQPQQQSQQQPQQLHEAADLPIADPNFEVITR